MEHAQALLLVQRGAVKVDLVFARQLPPHRLHVHQRPPAGIGSAGLGV